MKKNDRFFMLSTPLFSTTKIMHSAGRIPGIHINAEILQKFKLSNLNQSGMVLPQIFFSDQNLTILSEIEPPEASGKLTKNLVFNGNWIDININYSTTKTLIKILTIQILDTIPGYRTHPLWPLDKICALRITRLSAHLRWLGAYIAKYGIGLVL